MALERPDAGRVRFMGHDLAALPPLELRRLRRHFQMVFQDPYGSLDPRQTIARIVAQPLDAVATAGSARAEHIAETLQSVGLKLGDGQKYPDEISRGQRQRNAISP